MQAHTGERGFSLIEVMVALVILAVGMLGVGTMLVHSLESDRANIRTRNAELICQKILDEFKAMKPVGGWGSVTPEDGTDKDWIWMPPANPVQVDSPFVRRWRISDTYLPDGKIANVKQVNIIVGWPKSGTCTKDDPSQCKRTFRMTTYFNPLQ